MRSASVSPHSLIGADLLLEARRYSSMALAVAGTRADRATASVARRGTDMEFGSRAEGCGSSALVVRGAVRVQRAVGRQRSIVISIVAASPNRARTCWPAR